MQLGSCPNAQLLEQLRGPGLVFDFGAARGRLRSNHAPLAHTLRDVYHAYPIEPGDNGICEASVTIRQAFGLRRWLRPQIDFVADGALLFEPFPAATHLPLFEWGLNFLFAQRLNHYLLLHAGVLECEGRGLLLPALPGSGKSTLTAALSLRGFRLLSDEFGIVGLDNGLLHPLVRPVGLKNESIDIIRRLDREAVIGPRFEKTRKGTVAHLAPSDASVAQRHRTAPPSLIVFPYFQPGSPVQIEPIPKARAFAKLAVNSFNYEILGPDGFDATERLLARVDCYRVAYGTLEPAIDAIRDLLIGTAAP